MVIFFFCTDSLFSWKVRNVNCRKLPIIKMLTHVLPLVSSRRLFALAFLEPVQRNMRWRTSTSFTHMYQSSSCIWRKTVFWSVCTVTEMCLKPLSTGYVHSKVESATKVVATFSWFCPRRFKRFRSCSIHFVDRSSDKSLRKGKVIPSFPVPQSSAL